MKILLAGPGTGKTTNIKSIIEQDYEPSSRILVLSFTNATVNDLNESFRDNDNVKCRTLHSFAMLINPLENAHILHLAEIKALERLSKNIQLDFSVLCEQLNCTTFPNMISVCISFIKSNPTYINEVIGNIDLLIVDEFQDFNPLEQELIFELTKLSNESLILGDDDQSIYGFKDADPDAIINLHNDDSIENLDHEHRCYRCPDEIVDICTNLILKNKNRVEKAWHKTNKEGSLFIDQILNEDEVNNEVLKRIQPILEKGEDSILILSAVKYPLKAIMKFLEGNEIPIVDFIGDSVSKDDLLKVWLMRSVYSDNKILHILFLCDYLGLHARKGYQRILKAGFDSNIKGHSVIEEIIKLGKIMNPFDEYILNKPEVDEFQLEHPDFQFLFDLLDMENFSSSLDSLTKELSPAPEFEKNKVNVMTIHKSKGLGADHVFILGVTQGIMPNSTLGLDTIEAQRRLLYVGMTRAKKTLHIISQVNWAGQFVNTVNKSEFKFDYRTKAYKGRMSKFIEEAN